jgi:hypothetical protein
MMPGELPACCRLVVWQMFVWWWFPSGSDIAFFQYSPEKQEITGGTSSIRVGMGEVSRGNN